jgi:hypothetical protein
MIYRHGQTFCKLLENKKQNENANQTDSISTKKVIKQIGIVLHLGKKIRKRKDFNRFNALCFANFSFFLLLLHSLIPNTAYTLSLSLSLSLPCRRTPRISPPFSLSSLPLRTADLLRSFLQIDY